MLIFVAADMNMNNVTILLCFFLLTCSFIKASQINVQAYEDDRSVTNLPGQPPCPSISQFSGYVTVNEEHGRALFYWFFEAQSEPSEKPLLLWLNGGPGCSSLGGAVVEVGPLLVNKNGEGLRFNPYSLYQEANLLFVESPVGVGFSYTNTSSDFTLLEDNFIAEDNYNFLVNWLQRFPQFKSRDFFISGESYAGHYIPQLAELIFDRNKEGHKYPYINLKGLIAGNPVMNDYYDNKGLLEYAWTHAVISDQQYEKAKQVCNFTQIQWSNECQEAINEVSDEYSAIDIYNIYAPKCHLNSSVSSKASESLTKVKNNNRIRTMRIFGASGYDPCYATYAEEYFSRIDVQSSLHVKTNINWTVCNNTLFGSYNYTVFSVLPIYTKLIKGGLKIWIYSGDADGRVPVIGTRYNLKALGLPVKSSWRSWYHLDQVGGRIEEYEGLTFVTVRGAGHLVPLDKPSEALSLIHSFLTGQPLPTTATP